MKSAGNYLKNRSKCFQSEEVRPPKLHCFDLLWICCKTCRATTCTTSSGHLVDLLWTFDLLSIVFIACFYTWPTLSSYFSLHVQPLECYIRPPHLTPVKRDGWNTSRVCLSHARPMQNTPSTTVMKCVHVRFITIYTWWPKKQAANVCPISLPNIDRFSEFFTGIFCEKCVIK